MDTRLRVEIPFDAWLEDLPNNGDSSEDFEDIEEILSIADNDVHSLTPGNRKKLVVQDYVAEVCPEDRCQICHKQDARVDLGGITNTWTST